MNQILHGDVPEVASLPVRFGDKILSVPALRIVLALLFVAIPFLVVVAPLNMFVTDALGRRLGAVLLTATILCGYLAYVRLIERRSPVELSLHGAAKEFGSGVLIGSGLLLLVIGMLWLADAFSVVSSNGIGAALVALPGFILFAVLEEVVGRAILLRILQTWIGSWAALLVSSLIFGALHLFNPGATLLNALEIAVEAGILLGSAFLLTRRLWLCMGIHLAWNFTQGGVFSSSVSGQAAAGMFGSHLSGPSWLTGGDFGVEASVITLALCLLVSAMLLFLRVRLNRN